MEIKLIEIKQDSPGFNGFLGSWACMGPVNFLVDVGPANTSGRLIRTLESFGLNHVDYIFLTHIHIDHSGALADVLEHYPMAKVVSHEKGIKFLVDPSKLWAGSLSVLGDTARGYGEPKPVQEKNLVPHTRFQQPEFTIIETPGHAAHHLSLTYKDYLFAGEAAGNYFLVKDRFMNRNNSCSCGMLLHDAKEVLIERNRFHVTCERGEGRVRLNEGSFADLLWVPNPGLAICLIGSKDQVTIADNLFDGGNVRIVTGLGVIYCLCDGDIRADGELENTVFPERGNVYIDTRPVPFGHQRDA